MNVLSCGPKASNISGISEAISFPALHPQKSSQHVHACAAHDGAICHKNRKIVPYHRDSPNTRNGAPLRSPFPIMTPDETLFYRYFDSIFFPFFFHFFQFIPFETFSFHPCPPLDPFHQTSIIVRLCCFILAFSFICCRYF